MSLKKELRKALPVALEAARLSGAHIARKFGRIRQVSSKPDTSLVTEVDRQSERIVIRELRRKFPNDTIVAEETGLSEGQKISDFRWHIDPLDGTTNFVHGFPFFCVSIGLEHVADAGESECVLGVIYQPITGDWYWGHKGGGAFHNGKRLRVSRTSRLADSLLSTGFSMSRKRHFDEEIAAFGRIAANCHAVRRTGSAALDLVHVACGHFDGFWERGLNSWDVTAGIALLHEAGGRALRLDGKSYRLGDDSILATNGRIERELLKALRI